MKLFQLIADAINPVLDELFPADVQIIAEPGRYFAMSTTTMAVQIHSKRDYFAAPTVRKRNYSRYSSRKRGDFVLISLEN